MKKDDKASVSLKKIIVISLIMIFVMGIGVMATNSKVSNVKIILSNGYEMKVLTSKTKVSEILDENHIILLPEEKTVPKSDEELSDNKTIKISKKDEEEQTIANQTGEVTIEEILQSYDSIVEKIIKEQITIPYETVTKDVSTGTGTKQDKVVQKGEDGIKEITYKAKYQNDVEIEKVEISSEVIKEPVNKIVEVRTNQVTSRASTERKATSNPAQTSTTSLAKKVEGITPTVKTLNASAYTASTCGKAPGSSGYGRTSSGAMASSWYTVAAGSGYKLGTVIYIPYFANKPNGGWFVVQDRGGAISNNRVDVYMNTYNECISFGRRNLECYIYEF
ncbi:MAG TPA: G5 domain-containing protein [Clostridiaceae bacterium]|jgi:3D (Asp-Asp-Asp) domain-containing protein|nr:G5 domain-containing protein [Clostridiaceae bacterium]